MENIQMFNLIRVCVALYALHTMSPELYNNVLFSMVFVAVTIVTPVVVHPMFRLRHRPTLCGQIVCDTTRAPLCYRWPRRRSCV